MADETATVETATPEVGRDFIREIIQADLDAKRVSKVIINYWTGKSK